MCLGASRYRAPAAAPVAPPPVVTSGDPWTGASRYPGSVSGASSVTSPTSPQSQNAAKLPVVRPSDVLPNAVYKNSSYL